MNGERANLNTDAPVGAGGGLTDAHDQLEMLISRLADGEGGAGDWASLGALAVSAPDAWERLARAQREHAALSFAVGVALCAAERVELPTREAAERFAHGPDFEAARVHRIEAWSRVRSWGGWAAAAALVLAWGTRTPSGVQLPPSQAPTQAGMIPAGWTTDDAVNAYLAVGEKAGTVLGQVPQRVIIDRKPTADGKGYEITSLRQFVEKTIVSEIYAFPATDEAGRPVAVPVKQQTSPEAPQ